MYKIAIIGERSTVLPFLSLGFSVYESTTPKQTWEHLHTLVKSEEYAVIYLFEQDAIALAEELAPLYALSLPAITVLPSPVEPIGLGMANIRDAVERAVGADILFSEES